MLSGPHQRFAEGIASGLNATKAYQAAYPRCSYDSARTRGAALFAKIGIIDEVARLKSAVHAEFTMSKVEWLEEYRTMVRDARKNLDFSAAKGCLREIGLAVGWYPGTKLEVETDAVITVTIGA